MAYHDPFRRLVLSGTMYGEEGWSMGLTLAHIGTGDGGSPGTVSEAIQSACEEFMGSTFLGANAKLTTIKYNLIDVDGHYADSTETVRFDYDTPVPGHGGGSNLPQASLVVSLMTAVALGRAHTGRFYTPAFSAPLGTDGRVSEDVAALVAEQATTFLNAINADDDTYCVAVLSNLGAGYQNHVTHVRVGRVVDTMRSRRTSLDEGYMTGATLA